MKAILIGWAFLGALFGLVIGGHWAVDHWGAWIALIPAFIVVTIACWFLGTTLQEGYQLYRESTHKDA